ncbi:MAG TPA: hypothetical protein VN521_03530 [Negativicutes bacterium]|nr:hypothetical protein [Negativicutes bacterium]
MYTLQIPEFAAALRQELACDANSPCNECCAILNDPNCRINFGLDIVPNGPNNPIPNCECHDVCVQEVTMIASTEICQRLPYPPLGICRLGPGVTLPPITPGQIGLVYVICAGETLGPNCCSAVNSIQLLIILTAVGGSVVALPVTINVTLANFFDFPTCAPLDCTTVARRMKEIDGSCKIIQLKAVVNATADAILLTGKIVDKLWKHENLWFVGVRPYGLNDAQRTQGFISITVDSEFTNFNHAINPCTSNAFTCGT